MAQPSDASRYCTPDSDTGCAQDSDAYPLGHWLCVRRFSLLVCLIAACRAATGEMTTTAGRAPRVSYYHDETIAIHASVEGSLLKPHILK